jgi:MSHA pilin protein MshA
MRNQKGFTLIEIIAVLVILGILAAVAVPKYIDLAAQAKRSAAQGEVAEMKGSLNLGYAKLFMSNGTAPTLAGDVITAVAGTSTMPVTVGTAPDVWTVSMTGATTVATITVTQRGTDTDYTAIGTWNIPQ